MLAATIRMGIATISLNAVVRRLSLRSGYSTENRTGYAGSPVVWLLDSMAVPPPVARSTATPHAVNLNDRERGHRARRGESVRTRRRPAPNEKSSAAADQRRP